MRAYACAISEFIFYLSNFGLVRAIKLSKGVKSKDSQKATGFAKEIIGMALLLFALLSFLCLLGQTQRISEKMTPAYRGAVLFFISLMFFFGLFCALGCFNDFVTWKAATQFSQDLFSGEVFHIFYFLHNYVPMMVILQGLCYLLPMYCLWAQFKYMRLENTYKGRNIGLFAIKIIWLCLVMTGLSYGGVEILNWAYYIHYVEV